MRTIFFNIWHGQVWDKLHTFITAQSESTDIFNFIEVDPDLQLRLKEILPGYQFLYNKGGIIKYQGGIYEGQSIFLNKNIKILENQKIKAYEPSETDADDFLVTTIRSPGGKDFVLGGVHGTARPGNKLDTPVRLKQSKIIIDLVGGFDLPKIIGGDFNLLPQTESIKMFEDAGYRNLIKDFGIKETRNKLCWEQFPEDVAKFGKQHFADYCFTGGGVKVKNFEVPNIEASDHEPLIVDFEI